MKKIEEMNLNEIKELIEKLQKEKCILENRKNGAIRCLLINKENIKEKYNNDYKITYDEIKEIIYDTVDILERGGIDGRFDDSEYVAMLP